ncbi:MAG: YebC/PmpR family DNA-binding transcriptional regulator [Planctomycetota bacterium]
MAGHSKWANIKHRKGRQDAKRSKEWSKCSRAIIVAAKNGGGDPAMNLTLRYAIDEAKAANMPKDTIEKAVAKGAGAGEGDSYEEVLYEGYGPAGVAVLVEALTDNRNRTAPEMRKLFEKYGGNLGASNSVAFNFQRKGEFYIDAEKVSEDDLMEIVLEAGAEDIESADGAHRILTEPADYQPVRDALEAANLEPDSATLAMIPMQTVTLEGKAAQKALNFIDALDDHDDVQKVHANHDIAAEELEQLDA